MTGGPSILIVEDEPLISMMLEDFLDALGYRLAGCVDAVPEALAVVEQGGFDAALLDVNLRDGEMSWPIADALTAQGRPFILATGGGNEMVPDRHADVPVLNKPYTLDGVREAFEALLAG
ncbi:MAG: response regulator [Proteobacteria bacterium]|nr:response regulator [Pseudomonadota bacterium]